MRLHKRMRIVDKARNEHAEWFVGLLDRYDLTYIEAMQILTDRINSCLKYMLRDERHGDFETPADQEGYTDA